jgi:hypothetical protein
MILTVKDAYTQEKELKLQQIKDEEDLIKQEEEKNIEQNDVILDLNEGLLKEIIDNNIPAIQAFSEAIKDFGTQTTLGTDTFLDNAEKLKNFIDKKYEALERQIDEAERVTIEKESFDESGNSLGKSEEDVKANEGTRYKAKELLRIKKEKEIGKILSLNNMALERVKIDEGLTDEIFGTASKMSGPKTESEINEIKNKARVDIGPIGEFLFNQDSNTTSNERINSKSENYKETLINKQNNIDDITDYHKKFIYRESPYKEGEVDDLVGNWQTGSDEEEPIIQIDKSQFIEISEPLEQIKDTISKHATIIQQESDEQNDEEHLTKLKTSPNDDKDNKESQININKMGESISTVEGLVTGGEAVVGGAAAGGAMSVIGLALAELFIAINLIALNTGMTWWNTSQISDYTEGLPEFLANFDEIEGKEAKELQNNRELLEDEKTSTKETETSELKDAIGKTDNNKVTSNSMHQIVTNNTTNIAGGFAQKSSAKEPTTW